MCFSYESSTYNFQDAWFEVAFIRSNVVQTIPGGISNVIAAVVELMFGGSGHDMCSAGVHVKLNGGDHLHITASLGLIIADEAALHMMYMCKGSSGLKPCMLCANIFNRNDERDVLQHDHTGLAEYHTCSDFNKLVLHTSATIRAIIARLQAGSTTLTKGAFTELQRKLGWNFCPGSLTLRPRILDICDPVKVVLYDWMHIFFVNGVFNAHVGLFMAAMKPHAVTYSLLEKYIDEWTWPKQFNGAHGVLDEKRAHSSWVAETLKATASESLSLMPVLAGFVEAVCRKSSVNEVLMHSRCFLGLVDIIENVMRSARSVVDCNALERSISAYLSAFKALYGPEEMTPKFHYMMHYPAFLGRWHIIPNCFVLERKHKLPKRYANPILNTKADWEVSVLREVTNSHLASLGDTVVFDDGAALLSPHRAGRRMNSMLQHQFGFGLDVMFMASKHARMNEWDRCSVNDVVQLHDESVGEVVLHAAYQQGDAWVCFTALRTLTLVKREGRCKTWLPTKAPMIRLLSDIKCALTWAKVGPNVRTLRPLHG